MQKLSLSMTMFLFLFPFLFLLFNPSMADLLAEPAAQPLNPGDFSAPTTLQQVWDKARHVKEHAKNALSEALSKANLDSFGHKTSKVSSKAKDFVTAACRNTAAKLNSAVAERVAPTLYRYVPDERGRARIGRFATSFVRNAAVCGLHKTSEVSSKAKDFVTAACRISYNVGRNTITKLNSAVAERLVPTLNQYVPDERGNRRAKIGRFLTSFVRIAAVYGLPEFFIHWVPGGVPVYNIALRSLREEVKTLRAKVDRLERKLGGGGENIKNKSKFKRESSVGKNNQVDGKFVS